MIVGEQAVRLRARGRLEVVSLGYKRAHIRGGRDQSGGWWRRKRRLRGLYNRVTGRVLGGNMDRNVSDVSWKSVLGSARAFEDTKYGYTGFYKR